MSYNEWIISTSQKATEIRSFIEKEVLPWKHSCALSGKVRKYDFFLGCYGNPEADVVFMAEIPSLSDEYRRCPENPPASLIHLKHQPWKFAWNFPGGDTVFRQALSRAGFIPPGQSDNPSKWKCWLTDFVKCPETDSEWKKMYRTEKWDKIMKESSDLLIEELFIISPRVIVLLGGNVQKYYKSRIEPKVEAIDINCRHYSRMNSERVRNNFTRRIAKIGRFVL